MADIISSDQPDLNAIYLSLSLISIFYSGLQVIFISGISLVVSPEHLGTAIGIQTAILNVAQTVVPLVLGYICDTMAYHWVNYFLILMASIGLILTVVLFC